MYNELDWNAPENYHKCSECGAREFQEYHTQDHLKGLQLAMMSGNVSDIAFHLEEICSANDAEYIYKNEVKDE